METVKERVRSLELAFMGYNNPQTKKAFQQFARDNKGEIRTDLSEYGLLVLKDGTRITEIFPGEASRGIHGYHFDQLILADDSRKEIYSTRWKEIDSLLYRNLTYSCVPEEYKILFYDLDASDTEEEIGKGGSKNGSSI